MEFDLGKYLGPWYEIARIKNEFEPEMKKVMANYSLNLDGTVKIINSGYLGDKIQWIEGIAKTTSDPKLLRVSFYNNIFSDYRILFIDNDYSYALVGGNSDNYLWILSRDSELREDIILSLIRLAEDLGYNVDKLEFTKQ